MFSHTKKIASLYILAIFFIILDRFAKVYFYFNRDTINILNPILKLEYAENLYISFSLPLSPTIIKYLTLILSLIIVYIFINTLKKRNTLLSISLFSLILGSFSNILDRFKYGFVIDYINLKYFTIFNIADSMIFVSVILLMFSIYSSDKQIKTPNTNLTKN